MSRLLALISVDAGEFLSGLVMVVEQLTGRIANDNWIMTRHKKCIFAESEPEFSGLGHMLSELSRSKHGDDDVKPQKPG
jgi:hypothetical protein